MKIRFTSLHRVSWRDRFVEIARQAEGAKAPRSLVVAAGLRLRQRMSTFAPRRARSA